MRRVKPWLLALAYALCVPLAAEESGDELLAVVNDHEVRLSYVYSQIESMPLGDQLVLRQSLGRFIESVIQEEALFQWMLASDFIDEPELRERLKRETVDYLVKRHVTDHIVVPEDAIEAYYHDNIGAIRGEELLASHIVMEKLEECEALRATIGSMEEFAAAAAEHSTDRATAQRGGEIGWFMNHAGPYGFETELFEMTPGQMRVFETAAGCHLVLVREHVIPPPPPIEHVEERIRSLLARQQEINALKILLSRSERSVTIMRPVDSKVESQ